MRSARSAFVAVSTFVSCYSALGVVPFLSHWEASSGLMPDQVGYTLVDTSTPEDPVLSATQLTLANDAYGEIMSYRLNGVDLGLPPTLEISFRMRFVSGSSSYAGRAPAAVFATTAPGVGTFLWIGGDEIFFSDGENFTARGTQNTSIDTDSMFHNYLVRIEGSGSGSPVSVFQDGNLVLTGMSYDSTLDHGTSKRVGFGEVTTLAFGASEWESFTVVPEPTAIALLGLGALTFVVGRRRTQDFTLLRAAREPGRGSFAVERSDEGEDLLA